VALTARVAADGIPNIILARGGALVAACGVAKETGGEAALGATVEDDKEEEDRARF